MTILTDLLKKYTIIDHDFIDTFFKKFKIDDDLSFHIKGKSPFIYFSTSENTQEYAFVFIFII